MSQRCCVDIFSLSGSDPGRTFPPGFRGDWMIKRPVVVQVSPVRCLQTGPPDPARVLEAGDKVRVLEISEPLPNFLHVEPGLLSRLNPPGKHSESASLPERRPLASC